MTTWTDVTLIRIPEDRQRTDPGDVESLAQSIVKNGLFHAPIVADDGVTIIAGARRAAAVRLLNERSTGFRYGNNDMPPGILPTIQFSDLDDYGQQSIELEENLRRKQLTPIEEARAITKLHEMLKILNPSQTKGETATALGELRDKPSVPGDDHRITQALLVDRFHEDPDVARADSLKSAFNIAKKKAEIELRAALGAKVVVESKHRIIHGGFTVKTIEEEMTFDCVIADPPYGVGADSFGDKAFNEGHEYEDDVESALTFCDFILRRCFDLCKLEAHLYMFCDISHFLTLKSYARDAGWHPWRVPIIWNKGGQGHAPRIEHGPRRNYEAILFASKGNKKTRVLKGDVISIAAERDRVHAAQKPMELYRDLLERSCHPSENVLDPCCGSGTVFPAAEALGAIATGIERDEKYANICRQRIGALT